MDVWSQDRADQENRTKKSNGAKGAASNATEDVRELKGNLRFPLDFTYHGCPRNPLRNPAGIPIPVMEGNIPILLTYTVVFIFILIVFSLVQGVRKKI